MSDKLEATILEQGHWQCPSCDEDWTIPTHENEVAIESMCRGCGATLRRPADSATEKALDVETDTDDIEEADPLEW